MDKATYLKIHKNKRNNQLIILLKRKELLNNGKIPKYVKLKKKNLVY